MAARQELYKAAEQAIDVAADVLHELSDAIWRTPELYFQEHEAHRLLTAFLEGRGFPVQRAYLTDTAFRADYGRGDTKVAILCEYDALPEIGHACGHNLIAEVGVAASLGVKAALDAGGLDMGKLVVLGTPAEEGGGGKCLMLEKGAFSDLHVAMMTHPANGDVTRCSFLAVNYFTVTYRGKASHASGFPWEGVNALDAAVMAYNNISVLRQQMKPTWKVQGIISKGGTKPNIIPELSELELSIRAPNRKELNVVKGKVMSCLQAAATATGCTVDIESDPNPYMDVVHNKSLISAYESHLTSLGVEFIKEFPAGMAASTDMGNVSYVVPSIHPVYYIGSTAVNHTRDFTTASGDPAAQPYTLTQAKAMARTAIDVMCEADLLAGIKRDFQEDMKNLV